MRFSITRLCGGKALMVASEERMELDMERASATLSDMGPVKQCDDSMLVIQWNDIEVTIYAQGKVMFHPLADKNLATRYATEILERIRDDAQS